MAANPNTAKVERLVKLGGGPGLISYISKLPVGLNVPQDA